MTQDNSQEVVADTTIGEGEGVETISVSRKDYDTLNQSVGSLKRELKDLRKASEFKAPEVKETPEKTKADDSVLLQKLEKMSLRQAGLTHQDDVDLARATAKKWGVDIDEVLSDDDFKVKLERQQSGRSNVEATSGIKGGAGTNNAKNTPEYWVAKGHPPTAADVPDRKARFKIAAALMKNARTNNKVFYND